MATYKLRVTTAEGAASEEELRFANDEAALVYTFNITAGRALELRRGNCLLAKIDERPHAIHLRRMLHRSEKVTCH